MESYSQMVERPLFIAGRKPVIESTKEAISNEESGKIEDLILLGIYSIKGEVKALFNKKGRDIKGRNKKTLKKLEGEDVDGWLLKEIQSDRVILEQQGNTQTLMLRKPKPTSLKRPRRNKIPRKKTKLKPKKTA